MHAFQHIALASRFFQRLHELLSKQLSLKRSLKILIDDESHPFFKSRLMKLQTQLESGIPIHEALDIILPPLVPKPFSMHRPIPHLSDFFKELSHYYHEQWTSLQTLKQALGYPLFLLTSLGALLLIFLGVLLPSYHALLSSSGQEPPALLHAALMIGTWINAHFVVTAYALISLCMVSRHLHEKMLLTPFLRLFFPIHMGHIFWAIGLLMKSGLSLKAALHAIHIQASSPLRHAYHKVLAELQKTGQLHRSISAHIPLTHYQKECLIIGEQTNHIQGAFIECAHDIHHHYREKRARYLKRIQPILLLLMGGLIAGCLWISFLPMMTSIQHL